MTNVEEEVGGMKLAIGFIAIAAAFAQPAPLRFEVASAKPVSVEAFATRPTITPGRIRWTTQLCYLITYAYDSTYWDVSGPRCGAIYSIEATFAPGASDDDVRLMLRSLLADRFQLQFHRISKEVDGYALVAGKGAPRMTEAKPSDDAYPKTYVAVTGGDHGALTVTAVRASITQLAASLQRALRTPLWDKTGLTGRYDFTFRFAAVPGAETDAPALATALQEALGLKLEKRRGAVGSLVIDSVQDPSGN